jgi:hypothetical protein
MYTPSPVPTDPALLPAFLVTELNAIAQNDRTEQPFAFLQTLSAAPTKPREGMLVKADGNIWNPGFGPGIYAYINGHWVFVGGVSGGIATPTLGFNSSLGSMYLMVSIGGM